MDLLPLALQAMDDRAARGVLGDAFQSLSRDERRALWHKARKVPMFSRAVKTERWWGRDANRLRFPWQAPRGSRGVTWRRWTRAVTAVLLFGEWSTTPWPCWHPLARRYGTSAITGLEAWMPGTATVTGIDRAEGRLTFEWDVSPPTFAGVERTSVGQYTVTLASPDEVSRLERGDVASLVDHSFLREPSPEAVEVTGSLVALWQRETAAEIEAVRRLVDRADPPNDDGTDR